MSSDLRLARFVAGAALLALCAVKALVAQCPDGSAPPCRPSRVAPAPVANSVAVLYFDNLSPDTADAYLADGLTEEITARLGDLPQLQIKRPSRDAVRRLRDTVPDYLVVLGRLLRVRYLVEGSVRRAGTQVLVSARLVERTTAFACGARNTTGRRATSSRSRETSRSRSRPVSPAGSTRTLAGVTDAYERAIALDRFNAEAVHQYGSALAQLERDSQATAVLQQALAIEPQRPVTLVELSYVADINGRSREGLRWADSAVAMDPSFFFGFQQRGIVRLDLGDSAGARRDATTAVQLGDVDFSHGVLALLDGAAGDTDSARARVQYLRAAVKHSDRPTVFESSALAMALTAIGDTSGALSTLERAQPRGLFLWYSLRAVLKVTHLPPSPRLDRLIQESRPP